MRGGDPDRPEAGTWWFTVGGGIEPGETAQQAARREILEETGLDCPDVGPSIFQRRVVHEFKGVVYDQMEVYFRVEVPAFELDTSRWTDVELATVAEWRWWTREELAASAEEIYPSDLLAHLDA